MGRDFKFQRRAILLGVVLLVAADIALAAYSWSFASAPKPQQDLMMLTRNRDCARTLFARKIFAARFQRSRKIATNSRSLFIRRPPDIPQ
jgi:hypothetical protein